MKLYKRIINCLTIDYESSISDILDNYIRVYSLISNVQVTTYRVLNYFCNPITSSKRIIIELNKTIILKIKTNGLKTFSIYEGSKVICLNQMIDW